ncbi:MAG: SPOR domain-containing protein [Polaromonas sp.]
MSFFNFRRGGSSTAPAAGPAAQTESVEVMRKRARHRLIGAAVLVLLGVVGFPLLFDTQPRPIAVDIPIEIPGKGTVKPLADPAPAATTAPASVSGASPAGKVAPTASLASREEILPSKQSPTLVEQVPEAAKNETRPAPEPDQKPDLNATAKVQAKPASGESAGGNEAARASALLNGKSAPAAGVAAGAGAESRLVVQVGAFADAAKAREVRARLEKAGLKTYTQVVETKEGARTRVRVGPFASRADAEKAASKIKALELPTAILTL